MGMMLYDNTLSLSIQEREKKVLEGLRLIVKHLDDSTPVWATGRWISTYVNKGSGKEQRFSVVYSEQEAMARCKAANFLDCRIRAYHDVNDDYTKMAPSTLVADLDREHFKTTEEFELATENTYANFNKMLDGRPTQMWTGNGYHFLMPQFAIIIEKIERFKKFYSLKPSMMFLRFEEQYLTGNKADPCHSNNQSFGNCMLRIPGSLNSNQVRFNDKGEIVDISSEAEVRVVYGRHWDNFRPPIEPLLPRHYIWLQAAVARKIDREIESIKYNCNNSTWAKKGTKNSKTIHWIEKLLNTPLDDYRKYSIKFILARYLMNIRGLSRQETSDILSTWLNRCDSICRLRFDTDREITKALDMVQEYLPLGQDTLKHKFAVLYTRLEEEGIVY
jgi:Primase X